MLILKARFYSEKKNATAKNILKPLFYKFVQICVFVHVNTITNVSQEYVHIFNFCNSIKTIKIVFEIQGTR